MPFEFKFPDVGEGITEGEIVKWLVKEGDEVKEDQNIVQVETDKAVVDLPSPISGKILKINFKEGQEIKVGQTLVTISNKNENVSEKKESAKKEKNTSPVIGVLEEETETHPQSHIMKSFHEKILVSPKVRKLAKDLNIDLAKIKGSGIKGTIIKTDIKKTSNQETQITPQQYIQIKRKYDDYGYLERIPLKGIRKTIPKNMVKSITEVPQVTAMDDINVSKLWNLRNKEKQKYEKQKIKLTFLPFIIKAVIASLQDNPLLNSSLENEEVIIKKYYNIGVAVETELGLMVPVIKRAETKTIPQIAKEIQELAEKARIRTIDIMDLKGSSFTITNYGSIGGNYGTPIINPGESAILGLGRISEQPVITKGKIIKAYILPISLTFDHRVLDGAQAARFIESLKGHLEEPDHLLLELK